jgi:murein DD-endopeptidase MepM/ murein hydrolase activator NlpD
MNHFKKWHSQLPRELLVLGAALLLAAPVFSYTSLGGTLSWMLGLVFYHVCKVRPQKIIPLNVHLNLVAVGALLSYGSEPTLRIIFVLVAAAIATSIITTMLNRLCFHYWIPVLITPAILVFMAFRNAAGAGTFSVTPITSGQTEYLIAALTFIAACASPIFLGMVAIGTCIGTLAQLILSYDAPTSVPLLMTQSLSFAFCASILLMPSLRSMAWGVFSIFVLSCVAKGVSTQGFDQTDLLILTCSGNVVCAVSVYGARMFSRYSYNSYHSKPETKLEEKMTQWTRFRAGEARVGLPFRGTWKVSQGFDGAWTHRGIWRHGVDFVLTDVEGKTFKGNGFELTDYYGYGKDVLAPSSGYVVSMFHDFIDNPVGCVKNQNNFGNYLIIRDAFGAYAVLGHLKNGSISCSLYQYVEAGHVVAKCGNSGYSPEPHIHIHVQADPLIGSGTIPFHMTNYLTDGIFQFHGVPVNDSLLTRLELNNGLSKSMGFRVNESFLIRRIDTASNQSTEIENRLDPYWGSMYFTDGDAKLFHYRDSLSFYFYRYEGRKHGPLYDLMRALPRVPLIYGVRCHYADVPPVLDWKSTWEKWQAFAKMILSENYTSTKSCFSLNCDILEVIATNQQDPNKIETMCSLDPVDGFAEFSVKERKYEVKSHRENTTILVGSPRNWDGG